MDEILRIASRFDLKVIEDCAESLASIIIILELGYLEMSVALFLMIVLLVRVEWLYLVIRKPLKSLVF